MVYCLKILILRDPNAVNAKSRLVGEDSTLYVRSSIITVAFQASLYYLLVYFVTILLLQLPPMWPSFILSLVFAIIFVLYPHQHHLQVIASCAKIGNMSINSGAGGWFTIWELSVDGVLINVLDG